MAIEGLLCRGITRLFVQSIAAGCLALAATGALGQVPQTALPPDSMVASSYGVDMVTGVYTDPSTDLIIGDPASGGIEYKRVTSRKTDPDLIRLSNWDIKITERQPPLKANSLDIYYSLESMVASKNWTSYDGGQTFYETGARSEGISKLEKVGGLLRFTNTDGSVIDFNAESSSISYANKITYPNGVTYTITYGTGMRVVSNTGYALIREGSGLKVCVLNLATAALPGTNVCPAGARAVTYSSGSPTSYTKTDPGGGVTTVATSSYTTTFTRPGDSQPWMTATSAVQDGFRNLVTTSLALTGGPTVTNNYDFVSYWEPDIASNDPTYGRGVGWTVNGGTSSASTSLTWQVDESYLAEPIPPPRVAPGPYTITDPLGRTTTNHWVGGPSPYVYIDSKTAPSGLLQTYTYGIGGNVTGVTTTPTPGSGQSAVSVTYAHDCTYIVTCTKPQAVTDARGNTTNYTYNNTHGGMLTELQPADASGVRPNKTFTWAQYTATWSGGSGTVWLLSSISQCATQASCAGTADETKTTFTYNTAQNLLPASQTVQAGNGTLVRTTSWTYTDQGDKLSEDGPLAGTPDTRYWRYDAMRRVTGEIMPDPDGLGTGNPMPATRTTYDAAGRVTKVESGSLTSVPAATVPPASWSGFTVYQRAETDYDIQSRKTVERMIGSDNVIASLTQYSYDGFGRPECTAVRMNPAIYTALPASACTLGTQGSQGPDRITRTVYDAAGQVVQVRKGVGTGIEAADATFSYTVDGQRDYVIDANGNRAQLAYDGFDRQSGWVFPSTTGPSAYNDATVASAFASAGSLNAADYELYAYDANGNRTSIRKRDGSTLAYTYDALNRMTVKVVPERSGLSSTHTRDVYFGYDLRGLQTFARFDGTGGEGIANAWDALGQLTSETLAMDGASRTLGSTFNASGVRTSLTFPDGNVVNYYRNTLNRLSYAGFNGTGYLFEPSYYDDGTLKGIYRLVTSTNLWGFSDVATTYGYDLTGRLSSIVTGLAGTANDMSVSFTRNPASQIVTTTRDNDAYAWSGSVNVDRSYTTNGLNQYTAAGSASMTYDANGNLTSDGTNSYTYDIENRLVTRSGGASATLRYDPLGRLYEVAGTSGTTRFLYEGDALLGEYDGSGNLLRRYVHGPAEGVDDPLVWFEGSGVSDAVRRYLYADERGSIVAVSDGNGNKLAINTYDEYGIPGAGNVGRFQYTGQAWVPELGMYYYKARMYSPTLGRFMQTDPIGYEDHFNLYAYVANDPVNRADPTGLQSEPPEENERAGSRSFLGMELDPAEPIREAEVRQLDAQIARLSPREGPGLRNPGASPTLVRNLTQRVETLRVTPLANNGEARAVARGMGYQQVRGAVSHGQAVFTNGKQFISPDVPRASTGRTDSGGVWKVSRTIEGLGAAGREQGNRGTYNRDLTKRIGN